MANGYRKGGNSIRLLQGDTSLPISSSLQGFGFAIGLLLSHSPLISACVTIMTRFTLYITIIRFLLDYSCCLPFFIPSFLALTSVFICISFPFCIVTYRTTSIHTFCIHLSIFSAAYFQFVHSRYQHTMHVYGLLE